MHRIVIPFAASLALVACSSSYHPEYHPVTVTNVSYPVAVTNAGDPAARSPTYIVPGPSVATFPAAPAPEPPPGFFDRE